MSSYVHAVSDADLCAFLDGQVTASRHAEIAAALRLQPMMQAKLNAWRAQQNWLRANFAPLAQEAIPDFLVQALPNQHQRAFPYEVASLPPSYAHGSPEKDPRLDALLTWKIISMTLGILLFATALFASSLVTGATSCKPHLIETWKDQPKSLRGS